MDKLSEEEKKAVEDIKGFLKEYLEKGFFGIIKTERMNNLKIVLNLIEKQSKEIEHLKNLNEHQSKDIKKAVNYTFELKKEIERKDETIEEMAKEINKTTSEKYKIKHICEKGKCRNEECHEDDWNECIKEYFRNEVKNNESND